MNWFTMTMLFQLLVPFLFEFFFQNFFSNEIFSNSVALGGRQDKQGVIQENKLKETTAEFGLNIGIEKLISEVDDDGHGTLDFGEFSTLLSHIEDDKLRQDSAMNKNRSFIEKVPLFNVEGSKISFCFHNFQQLSN